MGIQPKVSIILVNYNGYKDTIECLQSLRAITYKNHDVIIVDNESTDESAVEISKYLVDGEIFLCSQQNHGFSAGNNIGMRYALEHMADYCLLLNNDTVVEPDFLDELIESFTLLKNCGLTVGKILYERKRDTIWYAGGSISRKTAKAKHWHYREKDEGLPDDPQKVSFATGCCMCLSRETIEKIGTMDENYFLYEEDADYCCRIANAGFDLVYVPRARIYHKVSSSTGVVSSISQYYSIRNKYMLIDKHFRGTDELIAKAYTTAQYLLRCAKGQLGYKCFIQAYNAYKRHETGKALR